MLERLKTRLGNVGTPTQWILWALLFGLSMIPLIKTLNELMTNIAIRTKGYLFLETLIAPSIAKMIGAILKYVFGVNTIVISDSIFLITRGLPYELYLSWNCIGWQSMIFTIFSMATGLQGTHSLKSKLKCIALGLIGIIALNLFRIVATALILLRWGYGPTIIFHDQISIILTFTWLAAYWYISNAYILEPANSKEPILAKIRASTNGVRLRSLLPDFIYGKRTIGLATMTIILAVTALGGVALLSAKVTGDTDPTRLSYEYVDPPVIVNTISTNRILTLPPLGLGVTHTDNYTTSSKGWERAWSFYLCGPLNDDYELKGDLAFVVYIYASQVSEVDIKFKIYAVEEDGNTREKLHEEFKDVSLGTASPSEPIMLEGSEGKKKTFEEGQSILVEIWFKSETSSEITYYFDYDSSEKHSYIDLPGVVVSENVMDFLFISTVFPPILALRRSTRKTVKRGPNPKHKSPKVRDRP